MSIRTSTVALAAALCLVATLRADELRNVKVGQPVPSFTLATLDGEEISSDRFGGKVLVLVFLSAKQKSSESAMASAAGVCR